MIRSVHSRSVRAVCVGVIVIGAVGTSGDWFYPEEEGAQCTSPPLTVTTISANGSVTGILANGTATMLRISDSDSDSLGDNWNLVGTVTSAQQGGAATSLGADYAVFECQQPSWGALVAVNASGVLCSVRKAVGSLDGLVTVPRYSYGPDYYDQIYTSASDVLQQHIINHNGGVDATYAQVVELLPPMPDVVSLGSSSPNVSRYVVGPDGKISNAGYMPAWAEGASGFDPMPYVIQDGILKSTAGGKDKCAAMKIVGCSTNFTIHSNKYFENAPSCCGGATSRSIPIKVNTSNADALAACEAACLQMSECTSAQINPSYPAPPGTCTLRKCQGAGSIMSGVTTAIRHSCQVAPPAPPPTTHTGNPQHLFDAIKPGMLGGDMRAVNMGYWSTQLFAGFELSALSTSLGGCQKVSGATLPEVCGRVVVRLVTQAPPSLSRSGKRVTRYFSLLAGVANETIDRGTLFYDAVFGQRRTIDARLKTARVVLDVPHSDRRVVDQARSALQQALDVYVGLMPNYGTGVYWSPSSQRGGGTADVTWPVVVALLDYGEVARAAELVTYYLQSGIYASPGWKPNEQYPGSGPTVEHPEWLPDTFAAYGKALHAAALVSRRLDGELQDQRGQGGAEWLQANNLVLEKIASLLLHILVQQQGRPNPPHNRTTPDPHHGGFKELWQGQCCDKKRSPGGCNSSAIPCGASVPASHYHDGLLTGPGDHDSCDSFQFAFFSINAWSIRGLEAYAYELQRTGLKATITATKLLAATQGWRKALHTAAVEAAMMSDKHIHNTEPSFLPPFADYHKWFGADDCGNGAPFPRMSCDPVPGICGNCSGLWSIASEYSQFYWYPELLSADVLDPELSKRTIRFTQAKGGWVAGMSRYSNHLDDMTASQWAYGLMSHNFTTLWHTLWMSSMAHGGGRGTFTAYEQFCIQADPTLGEQWRTSECTSASGSLCVAEALVPTHMLRWAMVFSPFSISDSNRIGMTGTGKIWLGRGAPDRWYATSFSVLEAPTDYGRVSLWVSGYTLPTSSDRNGVRMSVRVDSTIVGVQRRPLLVFRLRDATGQARVARCDASNCVSGGAIVQEEDKAGYITVLPYNWTIGHTVNVTASFG